MVSGRQFLKSDPASAQAVALGGDPLKRKTGMAGGEGDGRAGNGSGASWRGRIVSKTVEDREIGRAHV